MRLVTKAAVLGFLCAACGGGGGGEPGLVITSRDPVGGLSGSYERGGVLVRFDAIRGEAIDQALHPDALPYEIDARWADANGRSMLLQGSEDPADAEAGGDDVDGAARLAALKLVPEAAAALDRFTGLAQVDPERAALRALAAVVDEAPLEVAPEGFQSMACTIAYSHQFSIRRKPFALFAEHSAVRLWSYKRGTNCLDTLYKYSHSCNHGTCANSTTMTTKCSWASSWRSDDWPVWYNEPNTTTAVSGACLTPYGIVPDAGRHVCNDDSYVQAYGIRNNASYNRTAGTCADSNLREYAPSCT